jgi:hypothetical protein
VIYYAELTRRRTFVFIVTRGDAVFKHRELQLGPKVESIKWTAAKRLFKTANLEAIEKGEPPPPEATGYVTEVVVINQAEVTMIGGKAIARDSARIIARERAHVKLLDQSTGFAFSKAQLFPHREATAIAIEGLIVPLERGANCFVGPEAMIAPGFDSHQFDGTQQGFESVWRSVFSTKDPPRWPG